MKSVGQLILAAALFLSVLFTLFTLQEDLAGISSRHCMDIVVSGTPDGKAGLTHQREWQDYASSNYCLSYAFSKSAMRGSSVSKSKLRPEAYSMAKYWGLLYKGLLKADAAKLKPTIDSFQSLASSQALGRVDLAKAVVSFVQDIPYSYITAGSCESIGDTTKPCLGGELWGIMTPVEFLYSLSGDCDTRAVLLFGILKELGYQPLILVSKEYAHAVLALNIPASGDYFEYQGTKFYIWETTNKGWEPGMLVPNMGNLAYWKLALAYHEL